MSWIARLDRFIGWNFNAGSSTKAAFTGPLLIAVSPVIFLERPYEGWDLLIFSLTGTLGAVMLQALGGQLQAAQADKGRDERKLDIDAYKAVTDRLASVSAMVAPDMVRAMVIETLQDAQQTAARVPAEMAGPMAPGTPMSPPQA